MRPRSNAAEEACGAVNGVIDAVGAEVSAAITERCFLHLEAPITRMCGYDTPFPLVHEKYYLPDVHKTFDAICATAEF